MSEYLSIIHKYYPDYSLDDAELLLYELSEEGCGYAALIATLLQFFHQYSYNFMNIFGFPMYDNNGQSNADILLLHFYCMEDKEDYGMTIAQMMSRFHKFLNEYHLKAKMDMLLNISQRQLKEQDTFIILMTKNFILLDENLKKIYVNEWHYMNLKDVDEDGNFIVSSWGKNYILRKADIAGRAYFVRVRYKVAA